MINYHHQMIIVHLADNYHLMHLRNKLFSMVIAFRFFQNINTPYNNPPFICHQIVIFLLVDHLLAT